MKLFIYRMKIVVNPRLMNVRVRPSSHTFIKRLLHVCREVFHIFGMHGYLCELECFDMCWFQCPPVLCIFCCWLRPIWLIWFLLLFLIFRWNIYKWKGPLVRWVYAGLTGLWNNIVSGIFQLFGWYPSCHEILYVCSNDGLLAIALCVLLFYFLCYQGRWPFLCPVCQWFCYRVFSTFIIKRDFFYSWFFIYMFGKFLFGA